MAASKSFRATSNAETRVRAAALALPETTAIETWGRPTFRVRKQLFAAMHADLLILRSTPEEQEQRLRDRRFRVAPYWGRHGWVAIETKSIRSESELSQLLKAAWQLVHAS